MRTEITIPDVLVKRLKEAAEVSQISFDQAIEKALYGGIESLPRKIQRKPFRITPHHFGAGLDDPKKILKQMDEEYDRQKLGRTK